jgi:hypothetical protein
MFHLEQHVSLEAKIIAADQETLHPVVFWLPGAEVTSYVMCDGLNTLHAYLKEIYSFITAMKI